ncbi:MAG: hypothetical protein JWN65_3029 [Solirubrobacterales bacterium]|nr:hypothetical protein [Solirubrobacterales bacterium]
MSALRPDDHEPPPAVIVAGLRDRELAAARIEAAGATDALFKVQRELGAAQGSIAAARQELHDARVSHGVAEALLTRERAQRALERQAAQAQADERLAAAHAAHQRERDRLQQRVGALRGDIEATLDALRRQLDRERGRAEALEVDLAQRDMLVANVAHVAADVRCGLEAVRAQLAAERAAATVPAPARSAAPVTAPAAALRAGRSRGGGDLSELLERFAQIRGRLADHGVGTPPAPRADDDAR